jgi:hypothetical protein
MGRDSGSRGNHFPVAGMTYSGGEDEFDGSYLAQIQQILFCCPNFSMSQKRELPGANLRRAPMPQSPFFFFPATCVVFFSPAIAPEAAGAQETTGAHPLLARALSSSSSPSSSDSCRNPRTGPLVHPGPQWRRRARA